MSGSERSTAPAVETHALTRVFHDARARREVTALAGIDLRIERGEIFGLLGPNGAGKTTCIKILNTLLYPTGGSARVAGYDVVREDGEVRRRIALVSGGETSGYGVLTVRECLWMFSQFYGVPAAEAWRRVDALIEVAGLGDPEILFLDEPTLGMDVNAARDLRAYVARWVRERPGRTVLLTTHYMAEADELCDRIAIVDRGRVLAADSPQGLRRLVQGGSHVELEVAAAAERPDLEAIAGLQGAWGAPHPERGTLTFKFHLPAGRPLVGVLKALEDHAVQVAGVATRETSLEDVFIQIVGRGLDGEAGV
jgi:ABC-2 type transport system ATP-binding protein